MTAPDIPEDIRAEAKRVVHAQGYTAVGSRVDPVARALFSERTRATEAAAKIAERDADWSQFGKRDIGQWEDGPDSARDYRLGIVSGRAIAASIRTEGTRE